MAIPDILPEKPGKVIAVHVAFESRAAQRGRRRLCHRLECPWFV